MSRNKIIWLIIIAVVIIGGALFVAKESRHVDNPQNTATQPELSFSDQTNSFMKISSPSFQNNSSIPKKFSCEGQNTNPELDFSLVPIEAKSLALIVHDPDAPLAGGFTHWVLFNIDPKTSAIAENSAPAGAIQGSNGSGKTGYIGPCPSVGPLVHHYHFILYALDQKLNLSGSTTKTDLEKAISGHVIAQAELIGTYQMSNRK